MERVEDIVYFVTNAEEHDQTAKADQHLKVCKPRPSLGDVIGKIASSFYYVSKDIGVDDLALIFEKNEKIFTIGVVDENNVAIGIIIRREMFDILGKRFGRDVYKYKNIECLLKGVKTFDFARNIFAVSEELKEQLTEPHVNYFLLTGENNSFAGIFSTKDMLVYLSEITSQDINLAKKLQSNIVKDQYYLNNETLEIIGTSYMAKGVGGDFYIVKKYNSNNWIIIICDVSGKGISASLITAIIGGMFSIYDFNNGIKDFILKLNNYIAETFNLEKIVTGIFIDYSEQDSIMNIYDMAHGYIYLNREKDFSLIETGNMNLALGILQNIEPKEIVFNPKDGDRLFLITDGITDQRDPDGTEYGIERITGIVKENSGLTLKDLNDEIFKDIKDFRKNYPQSDDLTLLIINFKTSLLKI